MAGVHGHGRADKHTFLEARGSTTTFYIIQLEEGKLKKSEETGVGGQSEREEVES